MAQGVSVPESPSADALLSVQIVQYEMYDLGNVDKIPRFMLYDRKAGILIDITAEVKQAPLLSRTDPASVCKKEDIELVELFLSGEIIELTPDHHTMTGMISFEARELAAAEFEQLRTRMVTLAAAKIAYDEAIAALEVEIKEPCQLFGFSIPLPE